MYNTPVVSARTQRQAIIMVALSAILYGFMAFLGKHLIQANFSIQTMLFWRFFIAGLWMSLFAIFRKEKTFKGVINQRTLLLTFLIGAVCYAGTSGSYFVATQYTGTGIAMVIFFSYPLIVAIFAWLANRSNMNKYLFASLIAMAAGLYLLKGNVHENVNWLGILFALLSALLYAVYIFGSKWLTQSTRSRASTIIVCMGAALLFFILAIATHSFKVANTFELWLYLLAFGILATAIPIQLMLEGLRTINPVHASILSVLEPLVTVGLGILLLGEGLSELQIVGCIIILISTIAVQFQRTY